MYHITMVARTRMILFFVQSSLSPTFKILQGSCTVVMYIILTFTAFWKKESREGGGGRPGGDVLKQKTSSGLGKRVWLSLT